MGPGIVLLFWGFVFGVLGLIWFGLLILAIVGWKKKINWLKWVAGIPAGLMALCGAALVALVVIGIVRSMQPSVVFEDALGVAPSAEVSDIESRVFWFADTGSVYLRFNTTEATFLSLVPSDLKLRTMAEMKKETPYESTGDLPEWWTYQYDDDWIYFLRNDMDRRAPGKRGFYGETEYFAYDPTTGIAYYRFLGID